MFLCYTAGRGLKQDSLQAQSWLNKSAEAGYSEAQWLLGAFSENAQKAEYWLTRAAEQGVAAEQWELGLRYYSGEKLHLDYTKAVYWLTKAAEQGFTLLSSQAIVGCCYYLGRGVKQDYS